MQICPHCKKSLVFNKPNQFGAHIVNCKFNPKRKEIIDNIKTSLTGKKKRKKLCDKCDKQISISNFDRHYVVCSAVKKNKLSIDENWAIGENKYKCPDCEFISSKKGICSHIFYNHTKEGIDFKLNKFKNVEMKRKMGWSRGLKKETDIRVSRAAENQKKLIADGKIVMYWLGKSLSTDHKSKLSKAQSKVLNKKEISNNYTHVKYYKQKNINGEEYSLRGMFEVKIAQWLNDKKILWIKGTTLNYIKEGVERTYIPDFYLPKYDLYLEIKGHYPKIDQTKMKLVLQQNKINLRMIFKKTIKKLDKITTLDELF